MVDSETESRIHELELKLAVMPGSRAFVALAEEYRRAGRFDEALATLTRGLAAHPSYLSAQVAVARLYQDMGRIPDAVAAFQRVLAADRQNLVAAKSLADLYRSQGETLEALKKFKLYRALSGDPETEEIIATLERELNAPPGGFVPAAAPPEAPAPEPVIEAGSPEPATAAAVEGAFLFEEPAGVDAPPPGAAATTGFEGLLMPAPSGLSEMPPQETSPTPDAVPEAKAPEEIPASRTLADLYYDQGYLEDARRVYQRLAEANPGDGSLADRLREIADRLAEKPAAAERAGSMREMKVAVLEAWLERVRARSAGA